MQCGGGNDRVIGAAIGVVVVVVVVIARLVGVAGVVLGGCQL